MNLMVNSLINNLRDLFRQIPDPRTGSNTQFPFDDIGMAAFSVFFVQSPSFLDHQRKFQEANNRSACQSLFGMQRIPTDNHIRKQLDGIPSQAVYPAFDQALEQLTQNQGLEPFLRLDQRLLIAFDASQFHHSGNIHCSQCSTRTRKGITSYHHDVLCATIVAPKHHRVIPLRPEFIIPQDGSRKQDCENNAAKRWLDQNHTRYQHLRPLYLGDDLYSRQPLCREIIQLGGDFLFVAKPSSHKTLDEYLNGIPLQSKRVTVRKPDGKTETWRYQWALQMPIKDGKNALQVNWLSIEIIRKRDNKRTYRNSFITSVDVNRDNVVQLAQCGRARWKIENESFNMLKNLGYHMEHNFGHGHQGLSNLLLTLNLLAFTFHTTCDQLCELWQNARARFSRRHRFFVTLDIINNYLYFEDWEQLLSAIANPRPLPDIFGCCATNVIHLTKSVIHFRIHTSTTTQSRD